ncbi:putative AC9 transposase, partial [Bienertia sinuspersici]
FFVNVEDEHPYEEDQDEIPNESKNPEEFDEGDVEVGAEDPVHPNHPHKRPRTSTVCKSKVDMYFEEEYIEEGKFDILKWWKQKSGKYCILSKIAADVLAIPITTVASEATFSAVSRVIDPYRASLLPETVQMLICTGDWTRSTFGVKEKNKDVEDDQPKEIIIPIP